VVSDLNFELERPDRTILASRCRRSVLHSAPSTAGWLPPTGCGHRSGRSLRCRRPSRGGDSIGDRALVRRPIRSVATPHSWIVAVALVGPGEIAFGKCGRRATGTVGRTRRPVLAGNRASTRSSFCGRAGRPIGHSPAVELAEAAGLASGEQEVCGVSQGETCFLLAEVSVPRRRGS
jgi:hypothetical protein